MDQLNAIELIVAGVILAAFGITYNAVVNHLEQKQNDLWGYTSFFVALGTFITTLGTWYFIGTQDFLIVIGAFFCTGLPMIFGSVFRYIGRQMRRQFSTHQINQEALETAERILRNGYTTETGQT